MPHTFGWVSDRDRTGRLHASGNSGVSGQSDNQKKQELIRLISVCQVDVFGGLVYNVLAYIKKGPECDEYMCKPEYQRKNGR